MTEKRVISKWERKPSGRSMNQVVYITKENGKTTSVTKHEVVKED